MNKDWKEGVEYTCADTLKAKDQWEKFLLKIQEGKAIIEAPPISDNQMLNDLETLVISQIEYLKKKFVELSAGENVG